MAATITNVRGLELLDSRGWPTVSAYVELEGGVTARALVPSGASTGKYEAHELRDGDQRRYLGRGVRQAVASVNGTLREAVVGCDAVDQGEIDRLLCAADGTPEKSRLGANAILAVSIAVSKAAAAYKQQDLYAHVNRLFSDVCGSQVEPSIPLPMFNVINGGAHASNALDLQEFMIRPIGAEDTGPAIRMACEVYHQLSRLCKERGYGTLIGDEGGFAPDINRAKDALDLLNVALERANFEAGKDIDFALDPAASEFYIDGNYVAKGEGINSSAVEMVDLYEELCNAYPIASIEDGLDQDDIAGWKLLTERLGNRVQLVGDDLFVTNQQRLEQGVQGGYANSILIKINQIGTLSETFECMKVARESGYTSVISHRSGDTEDTAIADIAVGTGAGQIKTGAPARSERTAKFNRLLEIASSSHIAFAGK